MARTVAAGVWSEPGTPPGLRERGARTARDRTCASHPLAERHVVFVGVVVLHQTSHWRARAGATGRCAAAVAAVEQFLSAIRREGRPPRRSRSPASLLRAQRLRAGACSLHQ